MRRKNRRFPGIVYFADEPEAGKGGDGGGGTGGGGAPANVEATVRQIMAEGRTQEKLVDLHLDNYKLRQQLQKAEGGQQVPEGGRVLDADEAKAWEAYTALGKPDDVKKKVDRAAELEGEIQERDRIEGLRAAIKAAGYSDDAEATLTELRSLEGASFEVKDEKEGDKAVRVPYVTLSGEDSKAEKLDEYLSEKHPAIHATLSEDAKPRSTEGDGASYPRSRSAEERPKGKLSDEDFRRATEQTARYSL